MVKSFATEKDVLATIDTTGFWIGIIGIANSTNIVESIVHGLYAGFSGYDLYRQNHGQESMYNVIGNCLLKS